MLLKKGDKGSLVRLLQEALLSLGCHPGPIDGHFGELTENAIEKFQRLKRISADGLCGNVTFHELNQSLTAHGHSVLDIPKEKSLDMVENDTLMGWVACAADKIEGKSGFTRVTLRSDAADSYNQMREEVISLGGVLTSAGGRRGLSSKASTSRSKKSMHYVGLALDLALPTGMQNPSTDPYLIQMEPGRRWRIWCKTDNSDIPKTTIEACHVTRKGGKSVVRTQEITCRAFDLTEIFEKYGWMPINELLKVYTMSQAKKFIYWNLSKNCVFGKNWF